VVIGHAHWDHAGQLSDLPNAVLYVQREELKAIEWALNYPEPHIRAINSDPGSCNRTPACGYMPLTIEEVYGKVLKGKAVIVDGEMEILPGVRIHPAFRAHTAGSQLLEVPTSIGKLVFGSDAFSSYEGIRDWMTANVQQTDTVQQFLAYEKCYKITGGYNNCVAAHEPLSYTDKYPLTKNSWVALNGGRMAELTLAPGEKSRKP
jgi:glyoxylase-like metal-dependent hydrolase (beta-lactamase superfamily II)